MQLSKPIRFAAVPKSATRSLDACGLLGEVEGRPHSKILDYPAWDDYDWYVVDRPEADWNRSFWLECKRTRAMFGQWAGFKYENMEDDFKAMAAAEGPAPVRPGVCGWVTADFATHFKKMGMSLRWYCFFQVTCGIPCTKIPLDELDQWLVAHGYFPHHKNAREISDA